MPRRGADGQEAGPAMIRQKAGISNSLKNIRHRHSRPIPHDDARLHAPTMLFSYFGALAAAGSFLSLAAAHNVQLKAYQRECFHETLHKDDKMTVTFQVGDRENSGSGNIEIDFWVSLQAFDEAEAK